MPQETEDLEERFLDISDWGPIERHVIFRYNEDLKCVGEIVGFQIRPNRNFEAQIIIKDAQLCYQGTSSADWCEMGDKPRQYRFVNQPEIITRLLEQIKRKKRDKMLASLMPEDKDGFADDIKASGPGLAPVAQGRKGNHKTSAVKAARLPENTPGADDQSA